MQFSQKFLRLGSPQQFYQFCGALLPWCATLGMFFIVYGLIGGLFIAPPDYQQGDAFRIIYVHVPCAILSLLLYVAIAICSAIFLIWHLKIADMMAYCLAPLGAFFTLGALVTGAIWGKPMWGTWWVWDARLTSELILLFLYLGYIGLYHAIPSAKSAAKACAILAIVGVIDIPIIHYCVNWWNTLHQGATLSQFAKPSIESSMLIPLLSMITGLGFYTLTLLFVSLRTEIIRRSSQHQWVKKLILAKG